MWYWLLLGRSHQNIKNCGNTFHIYIVGKTTCAKSFRAQGKHEHDWFVLSKNCLIWHSFKLSAWHPLSSLDIAMKLFVPSISLTFIISQLPSCVSEKPSNVFRNILKESIPSFSSIPDICHRRDRRRLWRKIVHVEKFSPWHVVKWKISPHDKCGETLSHGEISPHYKCGENLSSGKFLHMRKVEKICHVEKFLLMRDVEKICQVGFK